MDGRAEDVSDHVSTSKQRMTEGVCYWNCRAGYFGTKAVGNCTPYTGFPAYNEVKVAWAAGLGHTVEACGTRTHPRTAHPMHPVVALLRPLGLRAGKNQGVVRPDPSRIRLQARPENAQRAGKLALASVSLAGTA